ncbi:formyltransferase family protein [Thalassotalea euphylliae]|nr:formyltransferase family protein [Thalassotalea euphylliae]
MTKTLFLGPKESNIMAWLERQGECVEQTSEKLSLTWLKSQKFDFLVSYGYRHILRPEVLALFPQRAINLHISYLPWNRGADPNFWSFFDNTPKGVTIHYIDQGLDTGNIIAQQQLEFNVDTETLASSYDKLCAYIEALFTEYWLSIKSLSCPNIPQVGTGSYHAAKDLAVLKPLLIKGWDTQIKPIVEAGLEAKR